MLSMGHNGMGNQLWQHTFAFLIAERWGAKVLIAPLPEDMAADNFIPGNTWVGIDAIRSILPEEYDYNKLSSNHSIKKMCDDESFWISDRKRAVNINTATYKERFKDYFFKMWWDTNPRCMKLVGFFQNFPLCRKNVRSLWTKRLHQEFPHHPAKGEVAIYLRCEIHHYLFNGVEYYKTILDRTEYSKVWLFLAPQCVESAVWVPGVTDQRKWRFHVVINMLMTDYNATLWPTFWVDANQTYNKVRLMTSLNESVVSVLADLSALSQADKLIIPHSSWGFWGGFLSTASEIHVNNLYHPYIEYDGGNYWYHSEPKRKYFGKNDANGKFRYAVNLAEIQKKEKEELLRVNGTASTASII